MSLESFSTKPLFCLALTALLSTKCLSFALAPPHSSAEPNRRLSFDSQHNNRQARQTRRSPRHSRPQATSSSSASSSSRVFVSQIEEASATDDATFTNEYAVELVRTLSPAQIEQEIISLGREGRIEQALEIYQCLRRPHIRQLNAIVDACSRAQPVRLELAFDLIQQASAKPNVYTFGSLMSVCARAGNVLQAVKLLKSMEEDYNVSPNAVVYNAAVSACDKADPPRPAMALKLLQEARQRGVRMSVVGYNAAISAAAHAGDWQGAVDLLAQMEQAAESRDDGDSNEDDINKRMIPRPDAVSYGTVLSAFEREEQWQRILHYADYMQSKGQTLDGLAITSVLHACQRLGLADEAIRYLNMMKDSATSMNQHRRTAGWKLPGGRRPLEGPDGVAYLLAVSACARGGSWIEGINLLKDYCKNPSIRTREVDVNIFTAAIKGCEYTGRWKEAFWLLESMRKNNVEPNQAAFAAVIGVCANACAKIMGEQSENNTDEESVSGPMKKAMRLLKVMGKDDSIVSPNALVYNAAIRTCAEAHDLKRALKVYDSMISEGSEPNLMTFGCLMTACERVGNTEGLNKVFNMMREEGFEANDVIFGAAISCCRKAGEDERALLLLRKMVKEGLDPNLATFNTVLMAQAESRNTANLARVYKYLRVGDGTYSKPNVKLNRQTFNIIVRSFAESKQPKEAESVLRHMRDAGLVPDVDLYTLIVSAYERTGQPLQALRLMESMNSEGYRFYEDKVLNAAFKRALKMANSVGRRWTTSDAESWDGLDHPERGEFGGD